MIVEGRQWITENVPELAETASRCMFVNPSEDGRSLVLMKNMSEIEASTDLPEGMLAKAFGPRITGGHFGGMFVGPEAEIKLLDQLRVSMEGLEQIAQGTFKQLGGIPR